ncbi:hypothetical protein PIROE2DRAFT_9150, partial [Piromyces sp. E2]
NSNNNNNIQDKNNNSSNKADAISNNNIQKKCQKETPTRIFIHEDNNNGNEDGHNGVMKEEQSMEYESSFFNDTPSITSKIQRLDDMLEYCSLKHNVILNNNCSSKKEGLFHSNTNESGVNDEKLYFHTLQNNKISSSTSNSLNNFSSLSSNNILLNNRFSQNYHTSGQKSFIDDNNNNTSNLTLISDKDNNEHYYSHPPSSFSFSENFTLDGKGTLSDSMLKQSIYLKQDSANSSHTILQEREDDIQYYNHSIDCFTYGKSSSSSQYNYSNNNSNSHLHHPSIDPNNAYQINFSYDTENNYKSMDYSNRSYFNSSGSSNNLMPNNQYLHPNYTISNHDEMFYRNHNYPPQNTNYSYSLQCYNNKSTESFIHSTTSSVYNSSISSPMNMTKSPHNVPTNGFRGLHKSQRIENFQYYNSSSGDSVNNNY